MLNYIENLKNEYLQTDDEEKKSEIINNLRAEKESCNRIISEYLARENRVGIKCEYTYEHEELIINKINKILNNLK